MQKQEISDVLEAIEKRYSLTKLTFDDFSSDLVLSICGQFLRKGYISKKQEVVLENISDRIQEHGERSKPTVEPLPDGRGFLGVNCKTGDAYWYSWQVFESK